MIVSKSRNKRKHCYVRTIEPIQSLALPSTGASLDFSVGNHWNLCLLNLVVLVLGIALHESQPLDPLLQIIRAKVVQVLIPMHRQNVTSQIDIYVYMACHILCSIICQWLRDIISIVCSNTSFDDLWGWLVLCGLAVEWWDGWDPFRLSHSTPLLSKGSSSFYAPTSFCRDTLRVVPLPL